VLPFLYDFIYYTYIHLLYFFVLKNIQMSVGYLMKRFFLGGGSMFHKLYKEVSASVFRKRAKELDRSREKYIDIKPGEKYLRNRGLRGGEHAAATFAQRHTHTQLCNFSTTYRIR